MNEHMIFKDGDKGVPQVALDSNGQVALSICRICSKGEAELDGPCNMNYNMLAKEIFDNAMAKGFWDEGKDRSKGEMCALIVSELMEGLEADRHSVRYPKGASKEPNTEKLVRQLLERARNTDGYPIQFRMQVKDTIEDEMADAFIRILDTMYFPVRMERADGRTDMNVADYITFNYYGAPWFPSGNFAADLMDITETISSAFFFTRQPGFKPHKYLIWLGIAAQKIIILCAAKSIDLAFHVRAKMDFNAYRAHMHGGKKY